MNLCLLSSRRAAAISVAIIALAPSFARAQYYSHKHVLDAADHELDKAAWKLYHSSNQLNYAESVMRNDARSTEQRRQAALQQNASNQASASRIQWQAQLLDQSARINSANAQKIAQARATLAAESQRVEQDSRDCEKGLAALLEWRDKIAKHHAENQAHFKRLEETSGLGQQIVSEWAKANAEREVHLREDLAKLREKESDLDRREDLLNDKTSDLDECEPILTRIEASLASRADSQRRMRASQAERRAALAGSKEALDKIAANPLGNSKPAAVTPDDPATATTLADYMKYRKEVNAKTETAEWKTVTKDLPAEDGHRHYVKGWLAGNVLQRLMHVDAVSDTNRSITFYYWREGQLHSVFQVRNGEATHLEGVDECTNTYNFVDEKLVAWKYTPSTSDGLMDTQSEGFAKAEKRVLDNAIRYAEPIYEAIRAD